MWYLVLPFARYCLALLKYSPDQQLAIEKIIDEIYINAKEIKNRVTKELELMEENFIKELEELINK